MSDPGILRLFWVKHNNPDTPHGAEVKTLILCAMHWSTPQYNLCPGADVTEKHQLEAEEGMGRRLECMICMEQRAELERGLSAGLAGEES